MKCRFLKDIFNHEQHQHQTHERNKALGTQDISNVGSSMNITLHYTLKSFVKLNSNYVRSINEKEKPYRHRLNASWHTDQVPDKC